MHEVSLIYFLLFLSLDLWMVGVLCMPTTFTFTPLHHRGNISFHCSADNLTDIYLIECEWFACTGVSHFSVILYHLMPSQIFFGYRLQRNRNAFLLTNAYNGHSMNKKMISVHKICSLLISLASNRACPRCTVTNTQRVHLFFNRVLARVSRRCLSVVHLRFFVPFCPSRSLAAFIDFSNFIFRTTEQNEVIKIICKRCAFNGNGRWHRWTAMVNERGHSTAVKNQIRTKIRGIHKCNPRCNGERSVTPCGLHTHTMHAGYSPSKRSENTETFVWIFPWRRSSIMVYV